MAKMRVWIVVLEHVTDGILDYVVFLKQENAERAADTFRAEELDYFVHLTSKEVMDA